MMVKVMFLKTPKVRRERQMVFAYFPERFYHRRNGRTHYCYTHDDGECPCDDFYALHDCETALQEEYAALKSEMERVGYALEVIDASRRREDNMKRIKELRDMDIFMCSCGCDNGH